ncbi:MAG: Sec-independent protein translocase subunit TatB [Propionibacteriaceae bacterium]|nr:Sec-independent protein translocase subunit TatB [Propionibacteriaceae bacterium]
MIDFNGSEIVVLAVLAVIIFGPEKLPDLARKAARVIQYLRGIANDARGQLRAELGPEYADISLSDLNPRNLGQRLLGEETTQDLREAAKLLPTASELVGASSAAVAAPAATASPQPAATGPRLVAFDPEAT